MSDLVNDPWGIYGGSGDPGLAYNTGGTSNVDTSTSFLNEPGTGRSWSDWAGSASGQKVAAALKDLGGTLGGASKDAGEGSGAGQQRTAQMQLAQSQAYPSRGAAGLDALVQMLARRREALLTAATGGAGSGQPAKPQFSAGLLGF